MSKIVKRGKKTGEVERVTAGGDHSFRKDIQNIANYFEVNPQEAKKVIFELLNGKCDFTEASDLAVEGGAGDRDYKMIKEFHKKLFNSDTLKLRAAVKKHDDLLGTITEIQSKLKLTHADLKKEYQKAKNRKK